MGSAHLLRICLALNGRQEAEPVFLNDHESGLGYCGGTLRGRGYLPREVRTAMTALFSPTSGTGLVRQTKEEAAYTGRLLSAADGPAGELARSSETARPPTPAGTLAWSRQCGHGTGTAGRAIRLLRASEPAAAACCPQRTQRGPRQPTAPDCTNFARHARRRGGQPTPTVASLLLLHAGDPRPKISRDIRCHDPPGTAAALVAARRARAIRRTMPPAPARTIWTQ